MKKATQKPLKKHPSNHAEITALVKELRTLANLHGYEIRHIQLGKQQAEPKKGKA